MATGVFSNAIVPSSFTVKVGTSATRLKSSSILAVKFSVIAPASKAFVVGDSSVSATRGIPIAGGAVKEFEAFEHKGHAQEYDLAHFWAVATAASTTLTVLLYKPYKDR